MMRTNKLLFLSAVCISLIACDTPQKVVTLIDKSGKAERDYYAFGDSAFMAGNNSKSPFLFEITPDWTVTRFDSAMTMNFFGKKKHFNVKLSGKANRIEDFPSMISPKKHTEAIASPSERIEKKFRWFYTYYVYTGTYPAITGQLPVSPDVFLSRDEQRLMFQGDLSAYKGMNGMELNEILEDAVTRFWRWFRKCQYEVCVSLFEEYAGNGDNNPYFRKLPAAKEDIFATSLMKAAQDDADMNDIAGILDKYFETDFFRNLYRNNKASLDNAYEEKTALINLFEHALQYEISMPGTIITANTELTEDGRLLWKVNAFRFLRDDYILSAESRTMNGWAFAITLLLVVIAFYSLLRVYRSRQTANPNKKSPYSI